ncbi:MAG: hypothetical protein DWI48_01745 [Chloroflexi bacterium]|nr:MAG: hypothetical protein DWI48_01745 [Chloroflexota bacterium]
MTDETRSEDEDNGADWVLSWTPASIEVPVGMNQGASGLCRVASGELVVISVDGGASWDLPGGRPRGDESLRQTLDRGLWDEAGVRASEATLLGYARSACLAGPHQGLVLVRSIWLADVTLEADLDASSRLVVPAAEALALIPEGMRDFYVEIFESAGLV